MQQDYKTTDIVLAAYLKAKGFKMQGIERQGNRGTFIFADIKTDVITEYDLGTAAIEPKMLAAEIRSLTTAARR
jgi:hypothetical protein